MANMRARLQAMTWAAQAKDAALKDLQRRLKAALEEVEQGMARESALRRRAEKSEEAEEALASQMAEVEAEAFTRITETNKLLAAVTSQVEPMRTSQLSVQVGELQMRLQAALEEGAAWARQCDVLQKEAEQVRVREAALQRRAEIAEEAEEALASQMAELEAEAFTRITESSKLLTGRKGEERNWVHEEREASEVAELERRVAGAEEALEVAHAKLRQAEEKNCSLELRLAQLAQEGEKVVTVKRKQGEETLLSLSLQDLAGFVTLWNPVLITSPLVKPILQKS